MAKRPIFRNLEGRRATKGLTDSYVKNTCRIGIWAPFVGLGGGGVVQDGNPLSNGYVEWKQ